MSKVFSPLLTHEDLRRWRVCSRRFWLFRQRALGASRPGDATSARVVQDGQPGTPLAVLHGPGVDAALHASFPLADMIAPPQTPSQWLQAMQHTLMCLDADHMAAEGWAILGACLTSEDRAQVRIDVLTTGTRGLRLFKVGYATVGDDADVDTVAFWTHVAACCGLRVQSVGLLLLDTDFIYPGHGCYAGVFREVDLAPVLGSRPVAAWLSAMRDCARGPQPPAAPGNHCTQHGGCEFVHICRPVAQTSVKADPQTSLEVVGRELAVELRAQGFDNLLTVPMSRLETPRQRRAVRAIQQGAPVLEPEVATLMHKVAYPRHFLRMDTLGFAVPYWNGTRPYQVLPFQWSCDVQDADGQLTRHGFLAEAHGLDPRRAFAQTLLALLGDSGPVLAYNAGFERGRIRELALHLSDLAPALEALLPRIVDLFQIARGHYYHPVMAGSWSFKSISRAVAPELQLDGVMTNGVHTESTHATFSRSLQRGLDAATRAQLRAALHTHGQRQTEVLRRMVALFEGAGV